MTPTWLAGLVCLAGLLSSRVGAIYWQIGFCLLGAAAALALPALGGAVITPAIMFLPFFAYRAWTEQFGRRYARRMPVAAVWLLMAVIIGLVGAFFLPRLFEGELEILTVDRGSDNGAAMLYRLRPVSGNITQSGYAVGSVLAFLSFRIMLEKPGRIEHFRDAVLLLASLDCAAALLNFGEFYLGFPKLLQYVRTAYSLFDAYEGAGGLMRIHGTFPETSAFSAFSLSLFAFTFSLWLHDIRSWYSGILSALLMTFLLLSTSTTAYVGLALYAAMLMFVLTYRGYVRGTVPRFGLLVAGGLLAIVAVGSFFVFDTVLAERLESYFKITVFEKLDSSSGVERSAWNRQAWSNFVDTYGLGLGFGTARASSLPLVLLSNLGALGTLCFVAFLKRCIGDISQPGFVDPVPEAARQALLASLASGFVSAAVFDLGTAFYAFAAAASVASVQVAPTRAYAHATEFAASRR